MINSLNRRKILLLLGQTVFGLILLWIWYLIVDLDSILDHFKRLKIELVLLALLFGLGATTLRIVRWKLILNPLSNIPFTTLLSLGYIQSLINYFVPIRAGELGITYLIKNKYKLSFGKVFAATFLNRAFDLLAGFTVATGFSIILSLFNQKYFSLFLFMATLLILSLAVFYFLIFQKKLVLKLLGKIGDFLPGFHGRVRLAQLLNDFISSLELLKGNQKAFVVVSLSLTSLLFDGAYLYFIFWAFGLNVSFMLVTFSMVLFTLSFLVPAAPLYIGTTELTGSLIFTFVLGISSNAAASVTVFWHLLNTLLIVTLGFGALWLYRSKKV